MKKRGHSFLKERERSATPFYKKERSGSGTPFFQQGAGAERHSKKTGALNTLAHWCGINLYGYEAVQTKLKNSLKTHKKIIFCLFLSSQPHNCLN